MHTCTGTVMGTVMGTVRPKSKQGNTTNLNISFSMENEKRAAQVGFETHDILLTRQMLYPCTELPR